jgi:hypothetical protein
MTAFYSAQPGLSSPAVTRPADLLRRKPQRMTITVSWAVLDKLQRRSDAEGRSLSNLAAHLLELATS